MLRGQGGMGKSFTIDSIVNSISEEYRGNSVAIMATTGMATIVIGGPTVHSHKVGLTLPVGKSVFKDLKGKVLQQLQDRYGPILLVIIDEFSIL